MFCFTRFCCICLKFNKLNFVSINEKYRDNITVLDKITFCFKEFQNIINYIPDAIICNVCRDEVARAYRAVKKIENGMNTIKSYADKLQKNNCKSTVKNLEVSMLTHKDHSTENNKRKKVLTETNENDNETEEIYKITVPWSNIIDDIFNKTANNKENVHHNKMLKDLMLHNTECVKVKQEQLDAMEIKSEPSIKYEPMEYQESTIILPSHEEDTISVYKEELIITTDCDIKTILDSNIEENNPEPILERSLSEPEENISELVPKLQNISKPSSAPIDKRRKSTPLPFPCPFCDNVFYSFNSMKRHLSMRHSNGRLNCNTCELSFKTPDVLKRHTLTHLRNKEEALPI